MRKPYTDWLTEWERRQDVESDEIESMFSALQEKGVCDG